MNALLEAMLDQIFGNRLFKDILETLSINLFSPGTDNASAMDVSSVLTTVQTLHEDIIKPVALMLVFLYFMIAVVDKLSSENFTWEQLWRQLGMLLAAKLIIDYGFDILGIIFNIGMTLASQVEMLVTTTDPSVNIDAGKMLELIEDGMDINGFLKVIAKVLIMIVLIIPWVASFIMELIVKIVCYSRIIEIYVRAVFMPVAVSDFFHTGLQSSGWRFLKNFLAIGLQGAMMLVIATIYSALYQVVVVEAFEGWESGLISGLADLFPLFGLSLAFMASACMLLLKSLSLAKEMVGTG